MTSTVNRLTESYRAQHLRTDDAMNVLTAWRKCVLPIYNHTDIYNNDDRNVGNAHTFHFTVGCNCEATVFVQAYSCALIGVLGHRKVPAVGVVTLSPLISAGKGVQPRILLATSVEMKESIPLN